MKNKSTQIVLKCTLAGFLLFNIGLLFLNQQYKNKLNSTKQKLEHLENIEIMFEVSKETTVTRFKYEQCNIGNSTIYLGSDNKTLIPALSIADIEQRFKDDYYGKKVVSFHQKEDYPLYEIETTPYFFILDKDLCVKLLFITDTTSPELTKEYLKIIKDRYMVN